MPVDRTGEERATFLIPKPKYEAFITGLEDRFWNEVIPLFTPPVAALLRQRGHLLPFPGLEIEDMSGEANQTLSLKRLANCMFYLKDAARTLESIKKDSPELDYMTKVGSIYMDFFKAGTLILALKSDTDPIIADLMGRLDVVQAKLQTMQGLYNPPALVSDPPRDVVFYIVNALGLIPAHIDSVRANRVLEDEKKASSIVYAQGVSRDVRRIIKNSDSYVKLILETPTFLTLFRQLGERYTLFADKTQAMVIENLQVTNENHCAAILLEADQCEARLSLKPGLLAGPVKEMLDVYYQGLLEPLNLSLSSHIKLATNRRSFDKRLKAILMCELKLGVNGSNGPSTASADRSTPATTEGLARKIVAHQGTYLKALIGQQDTLDKEFRENLIKKGIQTKIQESYTAACRGLMYNSVAYNNELIEYIKPLEDCCIAEITWGDDIDQQVDHWLKERIGEFEAEHLPVYYQLAGVESAIAKLGLYLDSNGGSKGLVKANAQTSAGSNGKPYAQLRDILDSRLLKHQRIAAFRRLVQSPLFKNELLAPDTSTDSTFVWLAKTFLFFLQSCLYRPTRQCVYDELLKSVTDPQIEGITRAIRELNKYIKEQNESLSKGAKAWVFESTETLACKVALVKELQAILDDSKAPNHTKIQNISNRVGRADFEEELCRSVENKACTLVWFIQKILNLFEALHLYKPTVRVVYDQLIKSVASVTPPALTASTPRNVRFFPSPPEGSIRMTELPNLSPSGRVVN